MVEGDCGDWEVSVEGAWRRYRALLADRIEALAPGEVLWVGLPGEEGRDLRPKPGVRLRVLRGRVVATVPADLVRVDDPRRHRSRHRLLRGLGWAAPGTEQTPRWKRETWYAAWPLRRVDEAAVAVVEVLRALFGLPHPVMLADPLSGPALNRAHGVTERADPERLIDTACAGLSHAGRDEDSDVPVIGLDHVLHVRALERDVVLLFSRLVEEVRDLDEAGHAVRELNERPWALRFVLLDRCIVAAMLVDASPGVPRQLRTDIEAVTGALDGWAAELAMRVGGRRAGPPGPDRLDLDVATTVSFRVFVTMHGQGATWPPELLAALFGERRDLLIAALDDCAIRAEVAWSNVAIVEDRHPARRACHEAEAHAWEARAEAVRAALRWVMVKDDPGSRQEEAS